MKGALKIPKLAAALPRRTNGRFGWRKTGNAGRYATLCRILLSWSLRPRRNSACLGHKYRYYTSWQEVLLPQKATVYFSQWLFGEASSVKPQINRSPFPKKATNRNPMRWTATLRIHQTAIDGALTASRALTAADLGNFRAKQRGHSPPPCDKAMGMPPPCTRQRSIPIIWLKPTLIA